MKQKPKKIKPNFIYGFVRNIPVLPRPLPSFDKYWKEELAASDSR